MNLRTTYRRVEDEVLNYWLADNCLEWSFLEFKRQWKKYKPRGGVVKTRTSVQML